MAQAMLDQANFSMIWSQSRIEEEQKDMETLSSTFTENIGDQEDQNSPQDISVVPKRRRWKEEKITVTQKLRPEIY